MVQPQRTVSTYWVSTLRTFKKPESSDSQRSPGGPPKISSGPRRVTGLRFEHALEYTDLCKGVHRDPLAKGSIGYYFTAPRARNGGKPLPESKFGKRNHTGRMPEVNVAIVWQSGTALNSVTSAPTRNRTPDQPDTHRSFDQVDTRLEVETKVDEFPFDAFASVFLLQPRKTNWGSKRNGFYRKRACFRGNKLEMSLSGR